MSWYTWDRTQYHPNYNVQARICKEQADWHCESCGMAQGDMTHNQIGIPYRVRLTASHDNHDPQNPYPALTCLCGKCHSRYGIRNGIRVRKRNRYQRQIELGQLCLFG